MNWDSYFLSMSYLVSMKSKDPSTKIGAVIVGVDHEILSTGFNGMPRGMDDTNADYNDRTKLKYMAYEHAERNAIYNAAKIGVSTEGSTMYTLGLPCCDCGRACIQAGIKRVVIHYPHKTWFNREKWKESCDFTAKMFKDCGILLEDLDVPLISEIVCRCNNQDFKLNQ